MILFALIECSAHATYVKKRVAGDAECYDRRMTASGFTLFDTAIGRCGVAWSDQGLVGVQLPEASEAQTRERMLQRFPAAAEGAPPQKVQLAIDSIVALLQGEPSDLSVIELDMEDVAPFH